MMFTAVDGNDAPALLTTDNALSLLNCYQDDDDEEEREESQVMSEGSAEPTFLPSTTAADVTDTTTAADALVCETVEHVPAISPVLNIELPIETCMDIDQESERGVAVVDESSVTSTDHATTDEVGQSEHPGLVESAVSDAATPLLTVIGHNCEEQLEAIPGECGLSLTLFMLARCC